MIPVVGSMGNGEFVDQSTESMDPSQKCLKSLVPEVVVATGPSTPAADRENVDLPSSDSKSSSSTMVNLIKIKPLRLSCSDSINLKNDDDASSACSDQVSSPQTPKDCVFDPFSATPERVPHAPLIKNHFNDYGVPVTRRLQFDSPTRLMEDDEETASEEELCTVVNENMVEAVVSKQTEAVLSQFSSHESDTDGWKTPPLAPYIDGVAQTCPGAPIKPSGKSRNIDLGLCRKLEF